MVSIPSSAPHRAAFRTAAVLALCAGLLPLAAAADAEVFLLVGRTPAGERLEARVALTTRADGTLWVERVAYGPTTKGDTLVGNATRKGDRVRVELQEQRGLSTRLMEATSTPTLRAVYRIQGARIEGIVRRDGEVVARTEGRRLGTPVVFSDYAFADTAALGASDGGAPVDVARINAEPSALLKSLSPAEREVRFPVLVVPGFASEDQGLELPLSPRAQSRAKRAARLLRKKGAHVILCSGANVHPAGTPFNEALELRRYLINTLGVPPWRVAIDPYARHTTTNLRNAGRFLLTHDLQRAMVVTSRLQSFYLSAPGISSYHRRCRLTLGYEVGRLRVRSHWTTRFEPSAEVFARGSDPLDP